MRVSRRQGSKPVIERRPWRTGGRNPPPSRTVAARHAGTVEGRTATARAGEERAGVEQETAGKPDGVAGRRHTDRWDGRRAAPSGRRPRRRIVAATGLTRCWSGSLELGCIGGVSRMYRGVYRVMRSSGSGYCSRPYTSLKNASPIRPNNSARPTYCPAAIVRSSSGLPLTNSIK